nr:Ornithine cyclodeaminase [Kibdelosporangium sp. MJ126-NF4]CTQ99423.1 Ornithine cyclodeaminase (EC 4.3.1.12) [Kibdelosporangium sp. MJ126-NF4]
MIVDDLALVTTSGALGTAGLAQNAADGTLSDVLRGVIPAHVQGPSVYTPVGLPWQDLALAWELYTAAARAGTGTHLDLLA